MQMQTRVVRATQLMTAAVDDDLVIMDPRSDCYTALDAIGRRIWDLLAQPMTVADLCECLAAEYAGEPPTIADDVMAFLGEMAQDELIAVAHE